MNISAITMLICLYNVVLEMYSQLFYLEIIIVFYLFGYYGLYGYFVSGLDDFSQTFFMGGALVW